MATWLREQRRLSIQGHLFMVPVHIALTQDGDGPRPQARSLWRPVHAVCTDGSGDHHVHPLDLEHRLGRLIQAIVTTAATDGPHLA